MTKHLSPLIGLLFILSGCVATKPPNRMETVAQALVGKPIDAAIKTFGPPTTGAGTETYFWNHTQTTDDPYLSRVQIGSEYTGRTVVGMTPGGKGVASMPIYQDNYRPIYEQQRLKTLNYLCDITMQTGPDNIIKDVSVIGCADSPTGL